MHVIDWEEKYNEEHEKVLDLQATLDGTLQTNIFLILVCILINLFFTATSERIDTLEQKYQASEEVREQLEDELEALKISLRQATGSLIDAAEESERLRIQHEKRLEELKAHEAEKEKQLEQLKQESKLLEEENEAAKARLEAAIQRSANDEKRLVELDDSKRYILHFFVHCTITNISFSI